MVREALHQTGGEALLSMTMVCVTSLGESLATMRDNRLDLH